MTMHQRVETPDQIRARRRERVRGDWYAYIDGWADAENRLPCRPCRNLTPARKNLYRKGWADKRAEMLKAG